MPRGRVPIPQPTFACVVCGEITPYKKRPGGGYNREQKCCGRRCGHLLRSLRARSGEPPTFKCKNCGKEVEHARRSESDLYNVVERSFCNRDCFQTYRKSHPVIKPRKDGYVLVWRNGKNTMLHRIVMEEIIGRPLLSHENVHHKNGHRADNAPENLELWSHSQPSGQRVEDKIAWAREFLMQYGYEISAPMPQVIEGGKKRR